MSTFYHGRRGSHDALCCCEYVNKDGQDSHILACCCDCKELDSLCDRLFKCQSIPQHRVEEFFLAIEDRLRIPDCRGKGAMKLKVDVVVPIVAVLFGLLIATINIYFTVLVLVTLPAAIIGFYQLWLRREKKTRTQVFFVWGFTSVIQMFFTFQFIVIPFREILLWENLTLCTLFGLTMYAFYRCKKGPGVVQRTMSQDFQQRQEEALSKITQARDEETRLSPVGNFLVDNLGMDKHTLTDKTEEEKEEARGHTISAQAVHWVDSRTTQDGRVKTWCRWCRVNKPPRAGHCPICNVCIPGRDHHCVWIDCCIGAGNHRAFVLAVMLVLVTGGYGVHLTLTTICTPIMLADWFLWPADCRFAYADILTSLAFVSACYSIIGLVLLAATLLSQCVLISQNVTSHEFSAAARHQDRSNWVRWGGFGVRNNVNDHGPLRNWLDFWSGHRKRNPKYVTVASGV